MSWSKDVLYLEVSLYMYINSHIIRKTEVCNDAYVHLLLAEVHKQLQCSMLGLYQPTSGYLNETIQMGRGSSL